MPSHRDRRRLLGRPRAAPVEEDLNRLVCLTGRIQLVGPTCLNGVEALTAVTVVDEAGLRLICRSGGPVVMRCGAMAIEVLGEIGVVVGSREEHLGGGLELRTLVDGDRVCARGMLRRQVREAQSGYRDGRVHALALAPFGAFPTIDIAFDRRPKGIRRRDERKLSAWVYSHLTFGLQLGRRTVVATPSD